MLPAILEQAVAPAGQTLSPAAVQQALAAGLGERFGGRLDNQRLLVLIPDHTRSLPLPFLFRSLVELLGSARRLDFMVALGTHPPLDDEHLHRLVGITPAERAARFRHTGLLNHAWNDPSGLLQIGALDDAEVRSIAGPLWHPSLPAEVPIRINAHALLCDHILIVAPTFPHEVAGFSGGAKYLFPGISGPEMINATHWLGALAGVAGTIGIPHTPVRAMIDAAAARLPTPVTAVSLVVAGKDIAGIFIGDEKAAWQSAAALSAERHIRWVEKPFQRVLSAAAPMYDELWTAAKAMYKLEPAVAAGGEVIIYAPHLDTVSRVHGKFIYETGYHTLPYFLADWPRFQHIPLGVLAHSTHLRGAGRMQDGLEKPNIQVTLASRISPEDCARLNLGYLDPASIDPSGWQGREEEGILYVPKAGEILYRLKDR